MNGIFTEFESRRLTLDERRHYLNLGLCTPVTGEEFEKFIDEAAEEETEKRLSDEVEYVERLREADITRHSNFVADVYACLEAASAAEIGAKLIALLDEA